VYIDFTISVNSGISTSGICLLPPFVSYVYADYADLQNDIDGLNYWVTANHLTFSSSKYLLSRKKNTSHPPTLKLGSSALDRVYS